MSTPIVILGMHRSGTSALAKSLRASGVWFGSEANITRRSEHALLQDCNQRILVALGGHWSAPQLPDGWTTQAAIAPIAPLAAAALDDTRGHDAWAWKDPRTCLTLPYWRARLDGDPVVVVSYRHPLEVSASLATRNDFGTAHSLALWEVHNRGVLEHAAGLRTIVVSYAALAERPEATLAAVHDALRTFGVALPASAAEAASAVEPGRRHHVRDDLPDDEVTPQQAELWHALCALPAVSERFVPPRLGPEHAASKELLGQRAATIRLQRDHDELARQLRGRRDLLRALGRALRPRPRAGQRAGDAGSPSAPTQ